MSVLLLFKLRDVLQMAMCLGFLGLGVCCTAFICMVSRVAANCQDDDVGGEGGDEVVA